MSHVVEMRQHTKTSVNESLRGADWAEDVSTAIKKSFVGPIYRPSKSYSNGSNNMIMRLDDPKNVTVNDGSIYS